ncbi:MAG: alpha/beta fold hydrolase [Actinomycetota bacterium]
MRGTIFIANVYTNTMHALMETALEHIRYIYSIARRPCRLALYSLIMVALGVIMVAPLTFPGVDISRVSFTNEYLNSRVAGLLIIPSGQREEVPAVIFSHGATTNKELYLPMCRELVRRGIAVLAIDLPGHGGSGGHSAATLTEYTSIWSAYDYLKEKVPEVDTSRIAAAGQSLGGISSTFAGVRRGGPEFRAVVAIYCWPSLEQALETTSGPLDDFVARLFPLFTWSRGFDITDESQLAERDIISRLSRSSPPNYLLVVGERDEMCTMEQEEALVAKAAGRKSVEPGETYGSFEDGTARELVITSDDHFSEVTSSAVFSAVYSWLTRAFEMEARGTAPFLMFRYSGWGTILLGAMLLGLAVALIMYAWLKDRGSRVREGPVEEVEPLHRAWVTAPSVVVYFLAISLVSLPLAIWLGIRVLVPFIVGDMFSSLAVVRGLLTLGGLALGGWLLYGRVPALRDWDWRSDARRLGIDAAPVAGGFAAFLFIYAPLARVLYLGPGLPYSIFWYVLFVALATFLFWVEGRYFHSLLLPLFGRTDELRGRIRYLASEAGTRAVALALVFVPLMSNPFMRMGRPGMIRLPLVVVVLIVGLPLYYFVAWLNLRARSAGISLAAPSLALALLQGWFLTAMLSLR